MQMNTVLFGKLRGFTLIELLIVIAVIGILMTAVLSAINPVEQLRKGTDTRKRSDAAEFLTALERYYTTFQCYSWQMTAAGTCNTLLVSSPTQMSTMMGGTAGCGMVSCTINELLAKNEIKKEFLARGTNGGFTTQYVTQDSEELLHVCFVPESKTFQAQATTRGLQRDGSTGSCTTNFDTPSTQTCHTCLPE
ncbi:MAG: type II secretion system protein [bacterium]|nr:type II secretion system protein [bacterium]